MSKQKMLAAKELIKEKHYHEARAILKTINHPTAKEWLIKLDRLDPSTRNKKASRRLPCATAGILLILIILAVLTQLPKSGTNSSGKATSTNAKPIALQATDAQSLTAGQTPSATSTITETATITPTVNLQNKSDRRGRKIRETSPVFLP